MVATGALHFVFNETGTFRVQGLYTNPSLAVIIVAVALIIIGIVMTIFPFFFFFAKKKRLADWAWIISLWFFIIACLTFFMTGLMGLIVAILSFMTSVGFTLLGTVNSFP